MDGITRKIGLQIIDLVSHGHLKPLHISVVFPFEETVEAFRYMQCGKHIGKVFISYEKSKTVQLPFRSATPRLQLGADCSYLIAGGFKGLCGSLAIYIARYGAKNVTVISRSGYEDARSQKVIYECKSLGCHVDLIEGDITRIEDVRRAFRSSSKPVVGVIQGAMVLRDRIFTTMTPQEFREPILPKVSGTWNLHKVAQEQDWPLDFFTMLSSISDLVGQLGQFNYAAGSAFLEAFTTYRLQQGLPACSIDLGPVEGVGYLEDKDMLNRVFEARGLVHYQQGLWPASYSRLISSTQTIPANSHTAIMPGNPPFKPVHRFS